MIILIQDISHHRFGAYISESLKFLDKSYGSGETFVFQLMNLDDSKEENDKIEKKLDEKHSTTQNSNLKNPKVYKWTSQNSLFVTGSQDSFAVGIDDGKFAIYLDSSLNQGRSQECQTFANEPLTPEEDFIVKTMEIWTFR